MKEIPPLTSALLRPSCDPNHLKFTTTAEITSHLEHIGQKRALEALSFGIEIKARSYHLYGLGPSSFGKHYFIQHFLYHVAINEPPPDDWCYVNNFQNPQKPIALKFPPGEAIIFKQDMKMFIEQLLYSIPEIIDSKEYRIKLETIESKYANKEEKLISKIQNQTKTKGMKILGPNENYEIVHMINDSIMTKEQWDQLSEDEKNTLNNKANKIKMKLQQIKQEMPEWYKKKHQEIKNLKDEFCNAIVSSLIGKLKEKYTDPKVLNYLRSVQQNIIEFPMPFMHKKESNIEGEVISLEKLGLCIYEVNIIISNDKQAHAPIIFERNPNYANLIGQLEGTAKNGTLMSDFTSIKPGSLHKSNSGYLILEIKRVLKNAHTWDSLKRILLSQKIHIEPSQAPGLMGNTQLQPEGIPLRNKVILLGDRYTYDLVGEQDDDFNKLFQVIVEFETTIDRSDELIQQFILYVARIIKRRKLGAFHKEAMAMIIDHCIRLAGDSRKISLQRSKLVEILEESRYWANKREMEVVHRQDVQTAIDTKIKRIDKIRKEYYDDILSGFILMDVHSEVVGQINGVSYIELSNFNFGLPTRITATTRSGKAALIDIQREANLGGNNHSKGVLILSGYLKGHYAKSMPFFLSASLVLEQTYGNVDGDSASLAELCALISSLSNVPIKQSLAVTGSVNQLGSVQSVGGINEKIEGFFDVCSLLGLNKEQGIVIPYANLHNLMLRQDVVEASIQGIFNIYTVKTVDEALLLLTGKDPDEIHQLCEVTLEKYATSGKA